jgi:hypothetical protein
MRARNLMLVPALALALLGSGCSAMKSTIDAAFAPAPKVVTQEATVAVASAVVSGTPVAGFPDTLPLWPGSALAKSTVTKTPQGKSYSASFTTSDPYGDVIAGMGVGLKNAGFTAAATDGSSGQLKASILMVSNDQLEGIITISKSPKKPVTMDYVVTPKK